MHTPSRFAIAIAAVVSTSLAFRVSIAATSNSATSSNAAIRATEAWTFSEAQSPDPSAPVWLTGMTFLPFGPCEE